MEREINYLTNNAPIALIPREDGRYSVSVKLPEPPVETIENKIIPHEDLWEFVDGSPSSPKQISLTYDSGLDSYNRILIYVLSRHDDASFQVRVINRSGGVSFVESYWDGESFYTSESGNMSESVIIPKSRLGGIRFPIHDAIPSMKDPYTADGLEIRVKPLDVPDSLPDSNVNFSIQIIGVRQ